MANRLPKKIAILGGGYAGVSAAIYLSQKSPRGTKIVLIDKNSVHEIRPRFFGVATADKFENNDETFAKYSEMTGIPLRSICKRFGVEFVQSEVSGIELQTKKITCRNNVVVEWDYLVLASGAQPNFFNIPGVVEFGRPLRTFSDAFFVRRKVEELIHSEAENISIVVGGGGFIGVEFSAQFACLLKRRLGEKRFEVTLVESQKDILPGLSGWIRKKAVERLSLLGVNVQTGGRIEKYDGRTVHIDGGVKIKTDLLVWSAGLRPADISSGVMYDPYLRSSLHPNIFVAGDAAMLRSGEGATAYRAISQGRHVSLNILRDIAGLELQQYQILPSATVLYFGDGFGVAEINGVKISGVIAHFTKWVIDLRYCLSVMSLPRAVSFWSKGIQLL